MNGVPFFKGAFVTVILSSSSVVREPHGAARDSVPWRQLCYQRERIMAPVAREHRRGGGAATDREDDKSLRPGGRR